MIDRAIIRILQKNGDVRYFPYTAPLGDIYVLGTDVSIKALIFKNSYPGRNAIDRHFKKGTPDSVRKAIAVLNDYFSSRTLKSTITVSGKDRSLIIAINNSKLILDLSPYTPKQFAVYRELLKIPAGKTISYGHLADRAGIPGGARFIGNAMAKNSFPIIIPCHRVIKSDGSMGNYSGGITIKKYLLDFEQSTGN